MNRILAAVIVALQAMGSGRAGKVETDFNPRADFSAYKTWDWVPDRGVGHRGILAGEPAREIVETAVSRQLARVGLRRVGAGATPDLVVRYWGEIAEAETGTSTGGVFGYDPFSDGYWNGAFKTAVHFSEIQAVLPWEPYYKLEAPLLESAVREDPLPPRSRLSLQLYPGLRERVLPILEEMGVKVFGEDRTPFGPVLMVVPPADALVALARLPEVEGIEPHYIRQPANDLGRERLQVATNTVVPDNYQSLDGAGVLVNVNDTGVEETHPDLTGPEFGPATFDGVGHGTHVAGTIASSGASGPQGDRVPGSTTNANYRAFL